MFKLLHQRKGNVIANLHRLVKRKEISLEQQIFLPVRPRSAHQWYHDIIPSLEMWICRLWFGKHKWYCG